MKRKHSSFIKDVEKDLLHCGVCFEKFTSTGECLPRILANCGHTYCSKCLREMNQRHGLLKCPSCRVETTLNRDTNIESLQTNYQTVQLLDVTERNKPTREEITQNACAVLLGVETLKLSLCMNCDGDSPQSAVWGCLDCSAVFCNDCNQHHLKMKVNKNHNVVTFEKYTDRSVIKCSKDPTEAIAYFCRDCEVMACEIGLSLHHASHTVSSIEEGAACEQEKLCGLSADIRELVSLLQSKRERVEQMIDEHRENVTNLHGKVESEVERLLTLLKGRSAAAHAEIEEMASCLDRSFLTEMGRLVDGLAQAQGWLKNVEGLLPAASAVHSCMQTQKMRAGFPSILRADTSAANTFRDLSVGSTGLSQSSAEGREGDRVSANGQKKQVVLEAGAYLAIDDKVTREMEGLMDRLFAIQELPAAREEGSSASCSTVEATAAAALTALPAVIAAIDETKIYRWKNWLLRIPPSARYKEKLHAWRADVPSSDPSFRALEAFNRSNGWVNVMVGSAAKIIYDVDSDSEVEMIDDLGEEEDDGLDDLSFLDISAAEVASALHLSLHDFGRVFAHFIRGWWSLGGPDTSGGPDSVYISESEDFVCMTKNHNCHMLYGDGSIRVAGAELALSRAMKISP